MKCKVPVMRVVSKTTVRTYCWSWEDICIILSGAFGENGVLIFNPWMAVPSELSAALQPSMSPIDQELSDTDEVTWVGSGLDGNGDVGNGAGAGGARMAGAVWLCEDQGRARQRRAMSQVSREVDG